MYVKGFGRLEYGEFGVVYFEREISHRPVVLLLCPVGTTQTDRRLREGWRDCGCVVR